MTTEPKKEETPVDNPVEPTKTPEPEAPEVKEEDNVEERLKELEEKDREKSRLLDASKTEALRLKKLNEELQAKASDDAPKLNDSDIELFKQYAKKAGLPFKEDLIAQQQQLYGERQQEALNKFLEEHPEYKPVNDKGNKKWNVLLAEYDTYKAPQNPKDVLNLLKKAHKNTNPEDSLEKGKALGMAQANIQEQTKLGGTSGAASTPKKKRTPEQQAARDHFKSLRPEVITD